MSHHPMNAFVAITNYRWFTFLANIPWLDEVNFWQTGGKRAFTAPRPSQDIWRPQ